ncbi:tetratricopeptide repeat protein [Reyranella sp.]|uniref:tetratricopeptide repeat protein n=1 Tax=Reyranella sp. TaxID=1929291 RepID=UPI003BABB553
MAGRAPLLILLPCAAGEAADERLLARGFTEDLQAELGRFRSLQLAYGAGVDPAGSDAADAAGPSTEGAFLLRTSLRRRDDSVRITATLAEAAGDRQLWHQRYDVGGCDLYAVEDDVVARAAVGLAARLDEVVLRGSRGKSIDNLEAYELWLRGKALLLEGTPQHDAEARALFERALALDPGFARAYAGLSLSWFNEWSCQHWNLYSENGGKAYEYAHQGLALDEADPLLHLVIGRVLLYRREFDLSAWYLDRAYTLSPNNADCLIQLSLCHSLLGNHGPAVECAEKAFAVHPFHPNWYHAYAAFPYLMARRIDEAIACGRKALGVPIVDLPAGLAICHALKGERDEARRWYAAFEDQFRQKITGGREPRPGEAIEWLLDINPVRRAEDVAFIRDGFDRIGFASARTARGRPSSAAAEPSDGIFVREGDSWSLHFAGRTVVLPHMKGLGDLATLLQRPGDSIHCFDLSEHVAESGGPDPVLDGKARRACQERIRDLQEELADAEDANDLGRAERARAEMDRLLETLSGALGLGGRARRLGSMAERARTTVTWRIRYAIRRIEAVHEPLGRHLRKSVRTGLFCAYDPETRVGWRTVAGQAAAGSISKAG